MIFDAKYISSNALVIRGYLDAMLKRCGFNETPYIITA